MQTERIKKGDGVPFTMVPNALLTCPKLSMKAKGLYAYLYSKPDDYDFAAVRIAKESKDGRDGILSAMAELVESGYVSRKKMGSGRVEYTIWVNPEQEFTVQEPEQEKPTVGKAHRGKSRSISNTDKLNNTELETTKSFEQFWDVYPRRIAKTKAEQSWNKIKMTPELLQKILTSVHTYRQTEQWMKDEGAYIPHPATWLNQERWDDEISPTPQVKPVVAKSVGQWTCHAGTVHDKFQSCNCMTQAMKDKAAEFYEKHGYEPPR